MTQEQQHDKPGRAQRLEISLDGGCACALWGQDLQDGEAVFVKIDGWPNATHKQEQAAMREAYELLCKAIGDRLPFDIVREHAKPSVALPETGTLSVPEGMKCVPTKPTEAVIEAMRRCVTEDGETCNTSGYSAMYQAAIKAAPTLPYAVSATQERKA